MLACASTPDVASRPVRPTRATRRSLRSIKSAREKHRLLGTIDEIWSSSEAATLAAATNDRRARHASDREERRRRCVKHVKRLLKKNLARAARRRTCNVESGANRANRPKVIRDKRATDNGIQRGADTSRA